VSKWPGFCARPELMATAVWMHRRNGDVWIITLCLRFLVSPFPFPSASASSSVSRVRKMLAIRAPRALD